MSLSAALTIGAVARRARVPLDTVRYYERRGLLPAPPRSASGYRQYPADAVRRVRFIKRAQALGFTLEEIAGLLALRLTPDGGCEAVERQAQAAMARIDAKLAELSQMRGALARMATTCRSSHPPDECPMLAALDEAPPESATVELIYFTGCSHIAGTRAALREAFGNQGLPARWEEWDQHSAAAPDRVRGYASPTVLVGGRDVTGLERTASASACRTAGGPSAEVIQAALAKLAVPCLALFLAACGAAPDAERTVPARWEARAPVPEARTEVSVATDGSLIYLVGGFRAEAVGKASAPRAMFAYDPAADSWTTPEPIPEGVNHAGLAAVDGKLYIIGGFGENTFSPTGSVRIYDPAARVWRDGAGMLTPRGALAVAVVDGKIHAIGGNAPKGAGLPPHEHGAPQADKSVGTHEVYDPAADAWTRLAPMPTPRNHLGAAVIGRRIHVVGGRVRGNMRLTTHEIYDVAAGSWTAGPPVPTGRSGIAVVAHTGMVYVFGGEAVRIGWSKTFDEAERFDPAAGRWERLPPMPTARHGLGAASVGEAIYVLGGGPRAGLAFGAANERLVELP